MMTIAEPIDNPIMHKLRAFREQIRRMWTWWLVTALALGGVAILSPQQLEVVLYKLCLVTIGVIASYWADRVLFKYAPPVVTEMPRDVVSAARLIARAFVSLGIVIGLTLGI